MKTNEATPFERNSQHQGDEDSEGQRDRQKARRPMMTPRQTQAGAMSLGAVQRLNISLAISSQISIL